MTKISIILYTSRKVLLGNSGQKYTREYQWPEHRVSEHCKETSHLFLLPSASNIGSLLSSLGNLLGLLRVEPPPLLPRPLVKVLVFSGSAVRSGTVKSRPGAGWLTLVLREAVTNKLGIRATTF